MTESADAAAVLASQPFSALVGARLTVFSEGRAEIAIPVTDQLKQQHGFLHGGVISYAADNALTFAGGSVLGPAVVTAEFKISYLRPVTAGVLVARASVVHAGNNQAVVRCELFASDERGERQCAIALGTIVRIARPPEAGG